MWKCIQLQIMIYEMKEINMVLQQRTERTNLDGRGEACGERETSPL